MQAMDGSASAMDWSSLMSISGALDPGLLKPAFIMVLIGYGTKAGLAPMHTWLPDAHSQAPTPVSALLSAVLLNCALYGVLRFHMLLSASSLGPRFSGDLMMAFGLMSMGVAAAFIIHTRDVKRMLAYSSVEHMGILAFGFGVGGPIALFGALFHMLCHSLAKTLMFIGAGEMVLKLRTRDMDSARGLMKVMPVAGICLLGGAAAITGCPPFGLFISETLVLVGGLTVNWPAAVAYLALLTVIFAAFMRSVAGMVFGRPDDSVAKGSPTRVGPAAMALLLAALLALGVLAPECLTDVLTDVAGLFPGGGA